MVDLQGAMALKKTNCPTSRSHQLSTASYLEVEVMNLFQLHSTVFIVMNFAGNRSCKESINKVVLFCSSISSSYGREIPYSLSHCKHGWDGMTLIPITKIVYQKVILSMYKPLSLCLMMTAQVLSYFLKDKENV